MGAGNMDPVGHTTSVIRQFWNDKTGERVELGPDRDALGLFEIRFYSTQNQLTQSVVLTEVQLMWLYDAIEATRDDT